MDTSITNVHTHSGYTTFHIRRSHVETTDKWNTEMSLTSRTLIDGPVTRYSTQGDYIIYICTSLYMQNTNTASGMLNI
jgi:uncharacterized FlgJ-related protein